MKTLFSRPLLIPLGIILVLSCTKELPQDEQPASTLYGYAWDTENEKIGIGSQTSTGWPVYWSEGDALRCRTASGTLVGTATLTKGVSQPYGEFSFTLSKAQTAGTPIRFVYPKEAYVSFTSNTLTSIQEQGGETNGSVNISNYAFAVADMTYGSDLPSEFKLKHILSYVCVKLSSSQEDYCGLLLDSATLQCDGAALSGTYSTNYSTLAVTPKTGVDSVRVNFKSPIQVAESEKAVWFACLPCDLTGKTVELRLNGEFKGNKTTVRIDVPGIKLEGGHANVIDLNELSAKDTKLAWYEPCDERLMAGAGYAYGPANTFLIQCKNGSTYTGGTYSPVDEYRDTIVFDFKARGDFSKVRDPKDFKFGWATKSYAIASVATNSSVYYPRTAEFTTSNISPKGYKFSVDRDNYTITVMNVSAHAGSPILLMLDESDNIVWGWTFWNIAADGTKLEEATVSGLYGSFSIANMDIGQPTTNYKAFAANTTSSSVDQVGRFINKYQWGRYLPTFWNTYSSLCWSDGSASTANIPAVKGPVSIEVALAHPYGLIAAQAGSSITDWLDTPDGNLWGGLSDTYAYTAKKTNYDPCPQGWMIPSARTMIKWKEYANNGGITLPSEAGQKGVETGGTFLAASGVYTNSTATNGRVGVSGMVLNGTGNASGWWGGHNYQNSGTPVFWHYPNNTTSSPALLFSGNAKISEDYYHSDNSNGLRARALAVRCMKDIASR